MYTIYPLKIILKIYIGLHIDGQSDQVDINKIIIHTLKSSNQSWTIK
jgi:hypothetical protein